MEALVEWSLPLGLIVAAVVIAAAVTLYARSIEPVGGYERLKTPKQEVASPKTIGHIDFYFGSQTGTAETFAKALSQEAPSHGFSAEVVDLETYSDMKFASSKGVSVFLMATYGEGDPTDNAMSFFKWINDESTSKDAFSKVNYCVFALGSTQYDLFAKAGKDTDKVLAGLGGKRLLPCGTGDENGTMDEDFETWKTAMWEAVEKHFGASGMSDLSKGRSNSIITDIPFDIVYHSKAEWPMKIILPESEVNPSTKHYFTAVEVSIVENRELRAPADGGSTRHIDLKIANTPLTYHTADNLAILPENSQEKVELLAKALNFDLETIFSLRRGKPFFPSPISIREALTRFCGILNIPRKSEIGQLANYAKDPVHKDRLNFLASREGSEDYKNFIVLDGRSICDLIVESFPSIEMSLEHFLYFIPHLQPRYYTISSSSSACPDNISATVAVTKNVSRAGRVHNGVCSSYLANPKTKQVFAFVRASTFRLPHDSATPIILIGPGTGIAPMRALLQERQYQRNIENKEVGQTILFFGCKRRDQDYIYESELCAFKADGTLSELHLAFSREGAEKVYVQHLLSKPAVASKMWSMVNSQNAHIYVCGATNMGHDVSKAFLEIFQDSGKLSESDATTLLKGLQHTGRYIQELWSA